MAATKKPKGIYGDHLPPKIEGELRDKYVFLRKQGLTPHQVLIMMNLDVYLAKGDKDRPVKKMLNNSLREMSGGKFNGSEGLLDPRRFDMED